MSHFATMTLARGGRFAGSENGQKKDKACKTVIGLVKRTGGEAENGKLKMEIGGRERRKRVPEKRRGREIPPLRSG
jgi:hypothetical protein